ncbi:DNA polymerase III subunit beta [Novosphingobium soli]|uniref:Beta sliding clamp n=1 Tax=Novosphingobium soli TaxID=574956 RepID=A0ABV6CXN4_9SPHN
MIQVDRKQFSRALDLAGAVVEARGATIPILGNLKVTANGILRLEGTDLDTHSRAELAYQGDGSSDFTLPQPRRVRAAINSAGGESVELTLEEDAGVHLRTGLLDSHLRSLPADDFPVVGPVGFEDFGATLSAGELKQIRRVTAAISSEETRYYLNGICVRKVSDWTYQFAATNGHVLMMVDVPLPDAAGDLPDMAILPRRFVHLVLQHFARAQDGLRLSYGHQAVPNKEGPTLPLERGGVLISLRGDLAGIDYSLTSKLIDGTYPDYLKVVPTSFTNFARFRRAEMVRAIQALRPLTFSKYGAVKITFPAGKLAIELDGPDLGRSVFHIDAEHDAGAAEGAQIGFNGNYLIGVMGALHGDEVAMQVSAPMGAGPTLFTDPADTAFKAVLMPTRV